MLTSFLQKPGLAFADVLPEENIQPALDEEHVAFAHEDDEVDTPPLTLGAFLSQVLFKGEQRSCAAAVGRVVVLLVARGKELSDHTGADCRARAKLPEAVLRRLTYDVMDGSERSIPDEWRWKGRSVKLVDGTTVSMPDTAAHQAEYPQPTVQKEGLGFPIARVVVLFSLATAMVGGMARGPYAGKETGETALWRELFERLVAGDIVLGDRYYCSYFVIAMLRALGVDVVTRQHPQRTTDFRRGARLGSGDHLVVWTRPTRPDWMDPAIDDRMPESLCVRELEVRVEQPGFRTQALVVVTTLTDAETYTSEDLGELDHQRWLVELDIRALKVSLGIDVLRCQWPAMVRRDRRPCFASGKSPGRPSPPPHRTAGDQTPSETPPAIDPAARRRARGIARGPRLEPPPGRHTESALLSEHISSIVGHGPLIHHGHP